MNQKTLLTVAAIVVIAAGVWAFSNFSSNPTGTNSPAGEIPTDRTRAATGAIAEIKPNEIIFETGGNKFTAQLSATTKYMIFKSNGIEEAIDLGDLKGGDIISVYFYEEPTPGTYKAEKIYKRN